MKALLRPGPWGGIVDIPPSKSETMRALVFALLAKGTSRLHHYLHSPDVFAMIEACRKMGAHITVTEKTLEIQGGLGTATDVIDAGNSGQIFRFIGAIAALTPGYTVITGDGSVRERRPIQPLLDGLTQLGAFAVSTKDDGRAPIIVRGPLKGGTAVVAGEDSQPISGLLIASAFAAGKTELFVTQPGEIPWIELTLSWFDRLGIPYHHDNFERYVVPGGSEIAGFEYTIPGDWSSAIYPIVAAVITGSTLTVRGVDFSAQQGDKEVTRILQEMGARIEIGPSSVTVLPGSRLRGTKIDVGRFIDAITVLPVIGCFAEGTTEIVGGKIARHKESDRIGSIVRELRKMGAEIEEREDGMVIHKSSLAGAAVESHADHRIALALAVAGLAATGESVITGVEVVSKSYPTFFADLPGAVLE